MILKNSFILSSLTLGLISGALSKFTDNVDVEPLQNDKSSITLDDVLQGRLGRSGYGGSWFSDTVLQTGSAGNFSRLNVDTNVTEDLTYGPAIAEYLREKSVTLSSVTFSPSGDYLLITHSRKNLWRSSYLAKYEIYTIGGGTNAFQELKPTVGGEQPELQLVRWAPTGNALAFVFKNNIYYVPTAADAANVTQITTDGTEADEIFNGHTDWVYEEEMFGTNNALWFSPDSSSLAFIRFDDTAVKEFTFPKYGEPGNRETNYPNQVTIRYPKSGEQNPSYSVNIVPDLSATNPPQRILTFSDADETVRHYIASVQWMTTTNSELLLITLNRDQTIATYFSCLTATSVCSTVSSQSEPTGWIDVYTPRINRATTKFLTLQYASNGRQHIFIQEGSTVEPISTGNFHVTGINAWDEDNNIIYFSGTGYENGRAEPSQTHIYTVDGSHQTDDAPVCITCQESFQNIRDEKCLSNSFSFSHQFKYVIHSCGGPNVPSTVLRNVADWSIVRTMEDNEALRTTLQTKKVPIVRDYVVPIIGNFNANVRLILPEDFVESKKYPLLIDVYGGPGSMQIGQGYSVNWGTSLVSDKEIIYGLIDGRGSGRQTKDILFQLNKVLGTVEIADQITAAKYMIDTYDFIDAERTAIWGWSYGGYATSMVMSKDTAQVFKCGISVAPVTNWLYYDTIYTERFMKHPDDNWANYNASDVTTHVDNFRSKKFFLIHGNADDNVHYQQSMILARALEQNDIMFRQLSYPDENHGINSPGMRKHLYHSLEEFLFSECFTADPQLPSSSSYLKPSVTFLTLLSSAILMFARIVL